MEINLFPILSKLITVWIATGILFFFFHKFFWESLTKYLNKREDFITSKIVSAKQSNEKALEQELLASEALKQARIDSRNILDRSKNEAIKAKEEIIDTANKEAKDKIENARLEINREKLAARKEIESEIVDIALTAAREVVKESIDKNKSEKIVDDFIKELKA